MASEQQLLLGIDLGTTSVKVALVSRETRRVVHTVSKETRAAVESGEGRAEQDVGRIFEACEDCLAELIRSAWKLEDVISIGVSGQMHGCVLWKSMLMTSGDDDGSWSVMPPNSCCSRLVTSEDERCSPEFLRTLPSPKSHLRVAAGFGCATHLWWTKHQPQRLDGFDCSGTVQDFLVARLCGLERPVMSVQNAASWGYYDTVEKSWNQQIVSSVGFPIHLLPEVRDAESVAGKLQTVWSGLAKDTPVGVALGDLQCSVLSSLHSPNDAVVNIGTSAQVAFAMPSTFLPANQQQQDQQPPSPLLYFPYFNDSYLAVVASLNGGNVLATLVVALKQWMAELGGSATPSCGDDAIYARLIDLAESVPETDLQVSPLLLGERHRPRARGEVRNITGANLGLGHLWRGACKGLAENLGEMVPNQMMRCSGVERIVGTGGALAKNAILAEEVERVFGLPMVLADGNAAVGDALALIQEGTMDTDL